jgi:hypothetical protein
VNAFEPVACIAVRPSAESSASRFTAITDLPVTGPALDEEGRLFSGYLAVADPPPQLCTWCRRPQ